MTVIEQAYANHQAFRTAHQEGDTSQISPLSGLAMVAATQASAPSVPSSSAAIAAAPPKQPVICAGCGKPNHTLFQCFQFLRLIGKESTKGGAATSHVASNASALPHPNSHS